MKDNPYKPGAGHSPPYLAGRDAEIERFSGFLDQDEITTNVILTGLRGVGKTVLMDDRFKPLAIEKGWIWVGSDFSESSFLSEEHVCLRMLTDLAVFSSSLSVDTPEGSFGFHTKRSSERTLTFDFLTTYLFSQPGLTVDKLKSTLELVWRTMQERGHHGIVFAYDEAQVVADRKDKEQYPLAVLLETFQSLQRRGTRFMLLLTGLPTLFPRLVESRTYAERMFSVQEIGRLEPAESRQAIEVPVAGNPRQFTESAINTIIEVSDGYPFFIQFICREAFDYLKATPVANSIPIEPILRKLDANFFAGRWDSLTDRQRDLLYCIALLPHADAEFMISEIVEVSKSIGSAIKPFTANDISQTLPRLIEKGLVYKNRHSKYSFAVPLFSRFINRRHAAVEKQRLLYERE